MSDNMHTLNFHVTSNIQHTPFHTSVAEQVHMPMNSYQGQTNMVSSASLYETQVLIILILFSTVFLMFIHQQ